MTTYYSKDHEWIAVDGDKATIGITTYAQEQLGDVVYVELPEAGKALSQGDEAAVVESVKAASEVYAPIDGEVVEANDALVDEPAKVNEDPEGAAVAGRPGRSPGGGGGWRWEKLLRGNRRVEPGITDVAAGAGDGREVPGAQGGGAVQVRLSRGKQPYFTTSNNLLPSTPQAHTGAPGQLHGVREVS